MEQGRNLIRISNRSLERATAAIHLTNKLLDSQDKQYIPYRKKDKWGFCDFSKHIVIDCIYDEVLPFNEGFAKVRLNNQEGYIAQNGTPLTAFSYFHADSFSEGFAGVCTALPTNYGFINIAGELKIPYQFSRIHWFSEGLASVQDNKHDWGFINSSGEIVVDFLYYSASPFSEGLAQVQDKSWRYGFIDKSNNLIIPCNYSSANSFKEGLAHVKNNGNWGFIDRQNNIVVPFIYGGGGGFSEGLASVYVEGSYGFYNGPIK
jgi:hypothetical protein